MQKKLILGVLAAATFGACAAPIEPTPEHADEAELTTGLPFPVKDERGCMTDSLDGRRGDAYRVRVRFFHVVPSEPIVDIQVYDAETGVMIDNDTYSAKKDGDKIVLFTPHSDSAPQIAGEITRSGNATRLTAKSDWLTKLVGRAAVDVTCDINSGARVVENPKTPKLAHDADAAQASAPALRAPSACLAARHVTSGKHRGALLRVVISSMTQAQGGTRYRAEMQVYDPDTGFVIDQYETLARKRSDGKGYELFDSHSSGAVTIEAVIAPTEVGGESVYAFKAVDEDLANEIGGVVPVDCDFVQ